MHVYALACHKFGSNCFCSLHRVYVIWPGKGTVFPRFWRDSLLLRSSWKSHKSYHVLDSCAAWHLIQQSSHAFYPCKPPLFHGDHYLATRPRVQKISFRDLRWFLVFILECQIFPVFFIEPLFVHNFPFELFSIVLRPHHPFPRHKFVGNSSGVLVAILPTMPKSKTTWVASSCVRSQYVDKWLSMQSRLVLCSLSQKCFPLHIPSTTS